ncbi:hypothetical protein DEO72_LG5g2295 [Vigna unguiculata]|uniref:Uncharacterized protein n=1 Tax=Vigna unguiculata TaxID=3917 RepID=A0A4D6M2E8_VIGUN|nr:hypothetical protein DEO72_LG5g2295 [Vigna unguiculata]
MLSATSRPGEKFWVLSDKYSRLGENGLPKRGEVCVLLGEGMSRSGEKSSPKRDVCGEATISHSLRRDGVA